MTITDDGIRAAEELLQEVLRAFKVRRLYEADHPQRAATEASATARIAAILEEQGAVGLTLEDGVARLDERPLSTAAGDASIVSILYHEGIREIVFQPGLAADELARFLDHVAAVAAVAAGERDLLARLWEETLPHLDYVFVERLADQEWAPDVAEPTGEDRPAAGPVVLEPEDRRALEMPVVSLPDPTAYRLTDTELAGLQAELEGEKARTLLQETLTCIRELLFDPPHDDPAPVVGRVRRLGLFRVSTRNVGPRREQRTEVGLEAEETGDTGQPGLGCGQELLEVEQEHAIAARGGSRQQEVHAGQPGQCRSLGLRERRALRPSVPADDCCER